MDCIPVNNNCLNTLQHSRIDQPFALIGRILGVEEDWIVDCVSRHTDRYRSWQVAKASGGFRTLSQPHKDLAQLQSRILHRIVCRSPVRPHPSATAFAFGCSPLNNATQHMGSSVVLRLDIKDFFPSIGFNQVADVFLLMGFYPIEARLLARLVTMPTSLVIRERPLSSASPRCLPQGASTSPAIANLVCRTLDHRLWQIAHAYEMRFTRYSDDIVFSAYRQDADLYGVISASESALSLEGFQSNKAKTRIMKTHQRQLVTGLVINDGPPRVQRRRVREFRAFLHYWEVNGVDAAWERLNRGSLSGQERQPADYAAGFLAYLYSVSPQHAVNLVRRYPWIVQAAPSLDRRLRTVAGPSQRLSVPQA